DINLAMMAALFVFRIVIREIQMGELLHSLISLAVASVPEPLPPNIYNILTQGCLKYTSPTPPTHSQESGYWA
ncbi:hypothetical protein, partial [Enterobacter mori]